MQEMHGAEYIARLWRNRLIEDLCSVNEDAMKHRALPVWATEINLPSWSWISVQTATVYPVIDGQGIFVPHCDVIRCTVDLFKSQWNRFGEVTTGELVLRGQVRKARLSYWPCMDQALNKLNSVLALPVIRTKTQSLSGMNQSRVVSQRGIGVERLRAKN
jgi:hypothetical protein